VQPLLQCKSYKYYIFWVCVCSLRYQACNAHAPCHLRPAPLYNIFPHYLTNGTVLGKKLSIKCVFWFYLQLLSETFLILRRSTRDMIKKVYRSSCKVAVIIVSQFTETGIFSTYFRKILKCQISWKSVKWELSCSMRTDGERERERERRTDRRDEANSRFPQFCECA